MLRVALEGRSLPVVHGCGWDSGAARERSSALAASVASRYELGADKERKKETEKERTKERKKERKKESKKETKKDRKKESEEETKRERNKQ